VGERREHDDATGEENRHRDEDQAAGGAGAEQTIGKARPRLGGAAAAPKAKFSIAPGEAGKGLATTGIIAPPRVDKGIPTTGIASPQVGKGIPTTGITSP
jgi:hypothetical protein